MLNSLRARRLAGVEQSDLQIGPIAAKVLAYSAVAAGRQSGCGRAGHQQGTTYPSATSVRC
jgi:hypothetical protein